MSKPWIPRNYDEACRRAAGRRRYHAKRRRIRDRRQMLVMYVLLKLNWKSYGVGRVLAKTFRVDPATISRDIRYILKWRRRYMEQLELDGSFVDAIIERLIAAGLHPRFGVAYTYKYENGVPNLKVGRAYLWRPPEVRAWNSVHPRRKVRTESKSRAGAQRPKSANRSSISTL